MTLPHVLGMRTIKTALAVTVGLYVAQLIHLQTPIFLAITCITGMKATFAESFKEIRTRMITTFFGVVLGYLLGALPAPPLFRPLLGGLGILIVISILVYHKHNDMVILSCIVYVASFVYPASRLIYGAQRIFGTLLGLVISLVINYLLKSPDVHETFTDTAQHTYATARRRMCEHLFMTHVTTNYESAHTAQTNAYKLLLEELHTPLHPNIELNKAKRLMVLFDDLHLRFLLLSSIEAQPHLKAEALAIVEAEYRCTPYIAGTLTGDVNDLFNLHVKKILSDLKKVSDLLHE